MPSYRIHRLRDHLRPQFRSAPHVSGIANIKPRDYVPGLPAGEPSVEFTGEIVAASSPYAAYFDRRDSDAPLQPGDVLEDEGGALRIFKFVGFEEARWVLSEPVQVPAPAAQPAAV